MRLSIVLLMAMPLAASDADTFLLRGVTVHPVSGPNVENASLLVQDGKIADIVDAKTKSPKGLRVIEGKGLHVYPGIIDSATEAGISEVGSVRETQDVNEIGTFHPQLRTSIAVNPESEHLPVIRANGSTMALVVPGGGILSGQASMMHLDGWTWEEMEVKRAAAMAMQFPVIRSRRFRGGFGGPAAPPSFAESKRNYERQLKEVDEYFEAARAYQRAKTAGGPSFRPSLEYDAMIPVLEGKLRLLVEAADKRPIKDAIAWAEKEKVKIILSGVRDPEDSIQLIAEKKIPVILPPTLALPENEDDSYDAAFTLPSEMYRAGVRFALGSFGNEFARNLPYQAATAVAFGLPYEEALKAITLYPAQIFGVDDLVGSIEKGKWADLMVTDGDPLEIRTQVKHLFIKGKEVNLESKHTRLYEKYMARP